MTEQHKHISINIDDALFTRQKLLDWFRTMRDHFPGATTQIPIIY